jgi:hypothetical protein
MTAPWTFRSLAAALLAVCVGLATLPGCGGSAPKGGDKKDEKKDEPNPNPNANPNTPGTPPKPEGPPPNTLGPVDPAVEEAANVFLKELMGSKAGVDSLTPAFVKVIGKPLVFQSDKEKGFSPENAASWLRKVGGVSVQFGPPMLHKRAGDVVYFRGPISGLRLGSDPKKTGSYSLRLKDGGAWKIDWLSLSSVTAPDQITKQVETPPTPEGLAQGFVVASFIESIADVDAMPKEERAAVIAGAMTPALRTAWAPPFDQDKNQGYDYNPGTLITAAVKIGGGTSAFTAARVGDLPEFKVELTKPAGKKTYIVRLVKGPAPHEWLVSEVVEAKVETKG